MKRGAIVLCGGKSTRMGRDKATLPFGPELMLQRVVRIVSQVVEPAGIVVVAAADQPIPALPKLVTIARDEWPSRGPLEGLAAGLRMVASDVDAVYATSCDVPLIVPEFIAAMFEFLGTSEIAVPVEGDFHHPFAAVYRPRVLKFAEALLAADRLRPRFLFDSVKTHEIPVEQLRSVDPLLRSLMNLNRPEDYQAALARAGFETSQSGANGESGRAAR